MRQQDALGRAGGAGGVLDVDHVLALPGMGRDLPAVLEHTGPGLGTYVDGLGSGSGEPGAGLLEEGAVIRPRVALPEKQDLDARLTQDVAKLKGAIGRIDIDQHGPDAGGRQGEQDPFDAVGGPQTDAVTRFDTEPGQAAGGSFDRCLEFGVGQPGALMADDEGVFGGAAADGVGKHLIDGLFNQSGIAATRVTQHVRLVYN